MPVSALVVQSTVEQAKREGVGSVVKGPGDESGTHRLFPFHANEVGGNGRRAVLLDGIGADRGGHVQAVQFNGQDGRKAQGRYGQGG